MARPKSDDKRSAILSAATHVIAREGLGAATAAIAKQAGVSNGSLFTYFETKADLLNHLYVELKTEMAEAALHGLGQGSSRDQFRHMWTGWLGWATASPDKRRALAQLQVSDEVTPARHRLAQQRMAGIARLLEDARDSGPMRQAPLGLVVSLMDAVAEATIDYMLHDPAHARAHEQAGFEAMWRIIA